MLRVTDNIALDDREVEERLLSLAGRAVTSDGVLVVVSRVHRSQADNRDAHARLMALLQRAAKPPEKRRRTKPRRAEHEARLASKKRRGMVKASRSSRGDE
jgi:ribosome-associated protein